MGASALYQLNALQLTFKGVDVMNYSNDERMLLKHFHIYKNNS